MRNTTCAAMTAAIEKILCSLGVLQDFMSREEFAVRISNPPFMPLTIERHRNRVVVAHLFEQNGDLVPDPDQEFEIAADHTWIPVAIQHAIGTYHRAIEIRDGKRYANVREYRDQIQFSRMWARNLIRQGFDKGTLERLA